MATYSRSQSSSTTTAESSISSLLSSKTISSLLVKSMQNVDDENMNEDGLTSGIKDTITQAINDSDLVNGKGGKDKDKNDKDLNNLLKDKQNTDKELTDLLKNKKNDDKELSGLLKNNNKEKGSASKALGLGAIGATIGAVLKSKSIRQAAGTVVSGAGKAAGGLISGVGNLGGSLIAGVGKLFGPIGGIIGKAVGTAVATPFKLVGGVITKAISGLGTLLSMPLKELVTKAGLILAVGSQIFVFLEGLIAKFKADSDLRAIDFAAKIKSFVSVIPDKIKLSLEQVLSKVRIMGKPIYGSLNTAEEEELGELGTRAKFGDKNDPLYQYDQLLNNKKTGIGAKEAELQKLEATMQEEYTRATGGTLDLSKYNLNTTAGKEALKADWLSQLPENERAAMAETINSRLSDYSYTSGSLDDAKKRAAYLEKTNPEIARYKELSEMANKPRDAAYFEEEEAKIDAKSNEKYEDYVQQGLRKEVEKGDLTAYEAERAKSKFGWGTQVDNVLTDYKTEHGSNYNFAPATAAEKFLDNQYKAWTNAWKDMLSHTLQNTVGVNVNVNQETSRSNPV